MVFLSCTFGTFCYLIGQKFGGHYAENLIWCRKFCLPKLLSTENICPPKIMSAENYICRSFVRSGISSTRERSLAVLQVLVLIKKAWIGESHWNVTSISSILPIYQPFSTMNYLHTL